MLYGLCALFQQTTDRAEDGVPYGAALAAQKRLARGRTVMGVEVVQLSVFLSLPPSLPVKDMSGSHAAVRTEVGLGK
jgi:hypothetical protein